MKGQPRRWIRYVRCRMAPWLLAICAIATAGFAAAWGTASASTTHDIRGTYVIDVCPGAVSGTCTVNNFPQTWTITSVDLGTGAVSGSGSGGGQSFTIAGTASGDTLDLTATEPAYNSHTTATISADSNSFTGTYTDSNHGSGTVTGTRLRPSATQVNCNGFNPDTPNAYFQCTAQVGDASGNAQSQTPSGTVSFSINPGGGGGFRGSGSCTLAPSQSGPTSFCAVNYVPPAGGVPIGSQPPLTASYSGDSVFAPSSAQPQSGVATGPPPPTTPPVSPPTELVNGCPVPTTPVDSVSTPTPPPVATTADLLPLPPPTVIEPAYCPYRAKYTVAEKAAAAQWADYYNLESARLAKIAAGYGGVAAASAAIPDPTISKVVAVVDGVAGAAFAYKAGDFNALGVQQGIINRDPSDPKWRTIATPLKTWPNRVPTVPSLSSRPRAALHAYFAAVLGNIANDWCVGTAINRASTALIHRDARVAKAQYRAGARCAAASMRFEGTLPRLIRAASGPLTRLLRHLSSAALTHLVGAREHGAAFRRKVAAREIALIRRAIALPTSALAQMQGTIANTVVTPPSASAVRSLLSLASSDAASALLEKQSAQVLAASG
jgi:hypothetical protein